MTKSKYIEWIINEKNHEHADMSSLWNAQLAAVNPNFSLFDFNISRYDGMLKL